MRIAFTTVANRADADRIARNVIEQNLAVCVQVDGPITSIYRWENKVCTEIEFRLCFKLLPEQLSALELHIHQHHPYEVPEWLVIEAERVSEKYLSWAQANSTNPPL